LKTGEVWFGDLGAGLGREQSGIRPLLVISNADYLDLITELIVVIPCTSKDRGWLNHVEVTGEINFHKPTFAIVEQLKSVSRDRLLRRIGQADDSTMTEVGNWVNRFMR